jgi:hypothetical protein
MAARPQSVRNKKARRTTRRSSTGSGTVRDAIRGSKS